MPSLGMAVLFSYFLMRQKTHSIPNGVNFVLIYHQCTIGFQCKYRTPMCTQNVLNRFYLFRLPGIMHLQVKPAEIAQAQLVVVSVKLNG